MIEVGQGVDGLGHGEVGLAGACGADAEGDGRFLDGVGVGLLAKRLGADGAAMGGENVVGEDSANRLLRGGGVVITVDPRSIGPGDAEGTLPWAARALQPHHDALIVIRTCRPSRHSSGTLHPIPTLRLESASVVAVGPGPRIAGGTRTSNVFRGFV